MVEPISIRLAYFEVLALKNILEDALNKSASKDARIDTVLLAEFFPPWSKKMLACYNAPLVKRNKAKLYQIPVSVSRILHYRLQYIERTDAHQSILAKLDQALTNRDMKPNYPIKLL